MVTQSTPTCPKCGYQATSSDDPLVKGPMERRECPACGIYLAKYLKLKQSRAVHPDNVWDPGQVSHALPSTASSAKIRVGKAMGMLAAVLLLIYGGIQWNKWSLSQLGDATGFKPVPWIVGASSGEVLIIGPT